MTISRNSSLSTHVSIDVSTSQGANTEVASATTSLDVGLTIERTNEPPPVIGEAAYLLISTDATAVGQDTLALTDIEALIAAGDWGSIIAADILLIAAATATNGDIAYSETSAAIETGYASFLCIYTMEMTQTARDGLSSIAVSTTGIGVLAVEGGGASVGETVSTNAVSSSDDGIGSELFGQSSCDTNGGLEGNLAIAEIYARAVACDTLIEIDLNVLTLEDQLSIVASQIILVAG